MANLFLFGFFALCFFATTTSLQLGVKARLQLKPAKKKLEANQSLRLSFKKLVGTTQVVVQANRSYSKKQNI